MSTSYNRRKTAGAFGSNRVRDVGYHYEILLNENAEPVPAASASVADPAKPNVAAKVIEFSRPILAQAGKNHTAIRGAMNVAILLWNAFSEGGAAVAVARQKLLALPDASPEQIDELIATMRERKNEVAPEFTQIVHKFDLNFTKYGMSFHVSTKPSSHVAGVEKSPNLAALGNAPAANSAPTK